MKTKTIAAYLHVLKHIDPKTLVHFARQGIPPGEPSPVNSYVRAAMGLDIVAILQWAKGLRPKLQITEAQDHIYHEIRALGPGESLNNHYVQYCKLYARYHKFCTMEQRNKNFCSSLDSVNAKIEARYPGVLELKQSKQENHKDQEKPKPTSASQDQRPTEHLQDLRSALWTIHAKIEALKSEYSTMLTEATIDLTNARQALFDLDSPAEIWNRLWDVRINEHLINFIERETKEVIL